MEGSDFHQRSPAEVQELLAAVRGGEPFLVFRDGRGRQRIVTLPDGATRVTLGRSPDNDVPLTWDERASRVHVELSLAGRDWVADDDGLSRNGTWVNGERLTRRRRLCDGDVLRIGATHVEFRTSADQEFGTTVVDVAEPPEAQLSPAQRRVLVALCRPLESGSPEAAPATNREIAAELFLSVEAVKTHLRALFEKFGVEGLEQNRKRSTLAVRGLSSGAVTPDDFAHRQG